MRGEGTARSTGGTEVVLVGHGDSAATYYQHFLLILEVTFNNIEKWIKLDAVAQSGCPKRKPGGL